MKNKKSFTRLFALTVIGVTLTFAFNTGAAYAQLKDTASKTVAVHSPVIKQENEAILSLAFHITGANENASFNGIDGGTYQEQLDEAIEWIEEFHEENEGEFVVVESIPKEEFANMAATRIAV